MKDNIAACIEEITEKTRKEKANWWYVVFCLVFGVTTGVFMCVFLYKKDLFLSYEELFISIAFAALTAIVGVEWKILSKGERHEKYYSNKYKKN